MFRRNILLLSSNFMIGMVYFLYFYISSYAADSILRSAHHHFTELVEVHGAGAVLVQLVDDPVQLLLGERLQQLRDQASQRVHRDEPFSILVVDSAKYGCC